MSSSSAASNVIEFPRAPKPPGLARKPKKARIVAIGGGKGGIGKTLLAANLGIALSQLGREVVIVDADLGGANLHTALGVAQPQKSLSDFLDKRVESLKSIVVESGIERLGLIAGGAEILDAAQPKHAQKMRVLRHLQTYDADYVILDLGAGTAFNTLDFFLIADHGVVVVLPEPTSIENAYRFIKAAYFRRLQHIEAQYLVENLLDTATYEGPNAFAATRKWIDALREREQTLADKIEAEVSRFNVKLVVNQIRESADRAVGPGVVAAWKKFFAVPMMELGSIDYDDEAWKSVRKRRPVMLSQPNSASAKSVLQMAQNLLASDGLNPTSTTR